MPNSDTSQFVLRHTLYTHQLCLKDCQGISWSLTTLSKPAQHRTYSKSILQESDPLSAVHSQTPVGLSTCAYRQCTCLTSLHPIYHRISQLVTNRQTSFNTTHLSTSILTSATDTSALPSPLPRSDSPLNNCPIAHRKRQRLPAIIARVELLAVRLQRATIVHVDIVALLRLPRTVVLDRVLSQDLGSPGAESQREDGKDGHEAHC